MSIHALLLTFLASGDFFSTIEAKSSIGGYECMDGTCENPEEDAEVTFLQSALQTEFSAHPIGAGQHALASIQGSASISNPQNVKNDPQRTTLKDSKPVAAMYIVLNNGNLFGTTSPTGSDAHCVHITAVTCPTGHTNCFLCVGKMVEVGSSPEKKEGLVVMVSDQSLAADPPAPVWMKTFGQAGQQDGANCALDIGTGPTKGIYVAGFGYNPAAFSVDRTLLKYDSTGTLVWQQFLDPASQATTGLTGSSRVVGGFEWISSTTDGIVLGGFINAMVSMPLDFKSYGNVDDCTATVSTISASSLQSTTPSLQMDITLKKAFSVKKVLQIQHGEDTGKFIALSGGDPGQMPTLSMIEVSGSTGTVQWQITVPDQSEATDVVVGPAGESFFMSGHVDFVADVALPSFKTYDARFTKVANKAYNAETGYVEGMAVSASWKATFGDNRSIIYDECWGLQFLTDAAGEEAIVAACASGVEPGTCSKLPSTKPTTFTTWTGPATSAECTVVGEKWANLNIRVNAEDGSLGWMRTDDFLEPESAAEGEKPAGSATEYSILTSSGDLMGVTDESDGIGFLKFSSV